MQRVISKQLKLERLAREGKSGKRHIPDKLDPRNDCKSKKESTRKRKAPKCGNCGEHGHSKRQCHRPIYDISENRTASGTRKKNDGKIGSQDILNLFDTT